MYGYKIEIAAQAETEIRGTDMSALQADIWAVLAKHNVVTLALGTEHVQFIGGDDLRTWFEMNAVAKI